MTGLERRSVDRWRHRHTRTAVRDAKIDLKRKGLICGNLFDEDSGTAARRFESSSATQIKR
jgi:hypothetical protein